VEVDSVALRLQVTALRQSEEEGEVVAVTVVISQPSLEQVSGDLWQIALRTLF